jgi:hypothetical protein
MPLHRGDLVGIQIATSYFSRKVVIVARSSCLSFAISVAWRA